jgi:hypothetical protein
MKNVEKYKEIWMDVVGYENNYMISNFGKIKNVNTGRILSPGLNSRGYYTVTLYKKGECKSATIHRLLLSAFLPNTLNKATVNHIDGDKSNNMLNNLEWATHSENTKHSYTKGLASKKGEDHGRNKLTENDVIKIKYEYKGLLYSTIAEIYGVHRTTISSIKRNKTWSHI